MQSGARSTIPSKSVTSRRLHENETLAVHAGHRVDPATGAVSAPIIFRPRSNATSKALTPAIHVHAQRHPNRKALEVGVSALEGGGAAAAFAPGRARPRRFFKRSRRAITFSRMSTPTTGPRAAPRNFSALGTRSRFIDMSDLTAVKKALRPKRNCLDGNASNPLLKIVDLAAIAKIVHAAARFAFAQHLGADSPKAFRSWRGFRSSFHDKIFRRSLRRSRGILVAKQDGELFSASATFNMKAALFPPF